MHCKYHPLQSASYSCHHCEIAVCATCSNEGQYARDVRCFLCNEELETCLSPQLNTPLLEKLDEVLRYPANPNGLTALLTVALLLTPLPYLPFGWALSLIPLGILLAYGMNCLADTATGNFDAPPFPQRLSRQQGLFGKLCIMSAIAVGFPALLHWLSGPILSASASLALLLVLPAVIMLFAVTHQLSDALKPGNILRLCSVSGGSYGLLLGSVLLIGGSLELIHATVGQVSALAAHVLMALTLSFYGIVAFHWMGLLLFRHRAEIGLKDDRHQRRSVERRSYRDRSLAAIQVLLCEGEWAALDRLFAKIMPTLGDDATCQQLYCEYLFIRSRSDDDARATLIDYLPAYLLTLHQRGLDATMLELFQRMRADCPDFLPRNARLRYVLAQAYEGRNDLRMVSRLLSGLYSIDPQFKDLIPAYQLLVKALDGLPGAKVQANKCRQLLTRLIQLHQKQLAAKSA
ncbi:hypothetical protein HCU74_18800 [Spongiibacter sp. KMU-166]|uniref:B box-type domain-containing protein n=1 Tax=Spongiibacter thalassae TaxID=2721624 RepID=A0ABX1GJW5_9GAMM|nr:hypothetical protein [Spongiibacter thalassae]NKI19461.1 hypothetical protein [Spongiibacter thalassae]